MSPAGSAFAPALLYEPSAFSRAAPPASAGASVGAAAVERKSIWIGCAGVLPLAGFVKLVVVYATRPRRRAVVALQVVAGGRGVHGITFVNGASVSL